MAGRQVMGLGHSGGQIDIKPANEKCPNSPEILRTSAPETPRHTCPRESALKMFRTPGGKRPNKMQDRSICNMTRYLQKRVDFCKTTGRFKAWLSKEAQHDVLNRTQCAWTGPQSNIWEKVVSFPVMQTTIMAFSRQLRRGPGIGMITVKGLLSLILSVFSTRIYSWYWYHLKSA